MASHSNRNGCTAACGMPAGTACLPGGSLFARHGGCRGFAGGLRCLAAGDAELFSAMLVRALFGFCANVCSRGCSAPSMRPLQLRQRCCFCWACPLWGRCASFCLRCCTALATAFYPRSCWRSHGTKHLSLCCCWVFRPPVPPGCLCMFGASALQVSGRIRAYSFRKTAGQACSGARELMGQCLLVIVVFLPLCGAATGVAYLSGKIL